MENLHISPLGVDRFEPFPWVIIFGPKIIALRQAIYARIKGIDMENGPIYFLNTEKTLCIHNCLSCSCIEIWQAR